MGRALRLYVATLVGALGLGLVATDAQAGCMKDVDCKGDRVCSNGECVEATASKKCETDKDCPGELVCTKGECTTRGAAPATSSGPTGLPAFTGTIRVFSTIPGTVYVDGGQVGEVGTKPLEVKGIKPGKTKVMVQPAGGAQPPSAPR